MNGYIRPWADRKKSPPLSARPLVEWDATEEDKQDVPQWEDNWDDDDLEDDFSKQLRLDLSAP